MLEKKISCTSAGIIPRPNQADDLLLSVMEDAEPEASGGVISSSYKSSGSFHSSHNNHHHHHHQDQHTHPHHKPQPPQFWNGIEPPSTLPSKNQSTPSISNHQIDQKQVENLIRNAAGDLQSPAEVESESTMMMNSDNDGCNAVDMGIPIIPGIVLSASDDGSIFGEGGFDEPVLLEGGWDRRMEEPSKVVGTGGGDVSEEKPRHRTQDMSIVPYSPPAWFPLPEEQIQFTMDISPAAQSLNPVPMSLSEDMKLRSDESQKQPPPGAAELDENFASVLPAFVNKSHEGGDDDASVGLIESCKSPYDGGDSKKLNGLNGDLGAANLEGDGQYDVKWVPPDGGWGWMVLVGSLIVNILIPGMVKSYGVLFIEFLEVFEASPASAAWIPALSYWLYSSMGPFASALAIRFSHRKVTILGGILASAGLALSYFATSVTYLYVSYGIIGGLGAGLAYPIGVFMVGDYFTTKRGLANGLCTSGSALGSVVLPPLLRALLNSYGYRIAILIMAGILLNVCLGALFYDPVEKHLKKVLVEREPTEEAKETFAISPEKPKKSDFVDIQDRSLRTGPTREIAASLPIAIPAAHHNERDHRRSSGSIRRATFQIGHDTPQGESWSLKSVEGIGTSPLALRLMKEETGNLGNLGISPRTTITPTIVTATAPTTHPFRYRQVQNQSSKSLELASDSAGDGASATSGNIVRAASGGQSRLNLTAIPEDDDNDSCCGSEKEMMITTSQQPDGGPLISMNSPAAGAAGTRNMYFPEVQPPLHHQSSHKPVRLSLGAGNQVISSSQMNTTGLSRTLSVASNVSTSSFHYVSTIHHGSLLSALQADQTVPEFPSSTVTNTAVVKSSAETKASRCSTCLNCGLRPSSLCHRRRGDEIDEAKMKVIPGRTSSSSKLSVTSATTISKHRKIIDFSLFKDGIYIIMLLSNSTTAVGYTNFIILLPAYAMIELGCDKSEASLLLSVVAGFDFFGRIGGAALSDLQWVSRKWFYIVGLFFSGVSLSLLPLATTYRSLFVYCACFGLASGTYVGVTAVILADELGPEKLGSSYGITLFVNGVFQLAGPPICGVLLEKYEKYQPILMTLGIILILGSMFWLAVPFIEHNRRKQRRLAAEGLIADNKIQNTTITTTTKITTERTEDNSISVV